MSPKGDPWSNAVQENFFKKLKNELIRGRVYGSIEEAKKELFWYIDVINIWVISAQKSMSKSIAMWHKG